MENDLYYDYDYGRFAENRFRPLVATVGLSESVDFQIFALIRSLRPRPVEDWITAYIGGVGFLLRL